MYSSTKSRWHIYFLEILIDSYSYYLSVSSLPSSSLSLSYVSSSTLSTTQWFPHFTFMDFALSAAILYIACILKFVSQFPQSHECLFAIIMIAITTEHLKIGKYHPSTQIHFYICFWVLHVLCLL